jgi:hypothetical protein
MRSENWPRRCCSRRREQRVGLGWGGPRNEQSREWPVHNVSRLHRSAPEGIRTPNLLIRSSWHLGFDLISDNKIPTRTGDPWGYRLAPCSHCEEAVSIGRRLRGANGTSRRLWPARKNQSNGIEDGTMIYPAAQLGPTCGPPASWMWTNTGPKPSTMMRRQRTPTSSTRGKACLLTMTWTGFPPNRRSTSSGLAAGSGCGHAHVSITLAIYSHLTDEDGDNAAAMVAGLVGSYGGDNVVPQREAVDGRPIVPHLREGILCGWGDLNDCRASELFGTPRGSDRRFREGNGSCSLMSPHLPGLCGHSRGIPERRGLCPRLCPRRGRATHL